MVMKEYLKRIGDVFNVEARLKEIDDGYEIYFNLKMNRYEVHNKNQKRDTFCLVVPFDSVDARLVSFVRKTRVERTAKLIEEIEKENEEKQSKDTETKRMILEKFLSGAKK